MEKTIEMGETTIKLKSSAATNVLFKRVFHEDILLKLTEYSKTLKEMQELQAKANALRESTDRPKEEILSEMNELLNSEVFVKANEFQTDTLPKLAFIMYLEANEPTEKLFTKLNEEQYLFWLMTINQDELLDVTGQVMEIWQAGARTHSKLKNVNGR